MSVNLTMRLPHRKSPIKQGVGISLGIFVEDGNLKKKIDRHIVVVHK